MNQHKFQPEAAVTTSGIFGTGVRGKAPSIFPSLPPTVEELRTDRVGYYHDILNTLPAIAFELDAAGRITFINDTALHLLGYSRRDAEGRPLSEFIPEGKAYDGLRAALDGINPGPLEYAMTRADGSQMPVRCTLTIIVNEGRVIGLRGIASDMTERAWMQQELEKAERRRASYESAARSGHDLRNVLCALQGGIGFLQTFDLRNLGPDDIREIGEILRDQMEAIERGTRLTGDMMQLASADRMSWSRVDLGRMIERIMKEQRQRCSGRGIVMLFDSDVQVVLSRADRDKLYRAIDNMVTNAIDSMDGNGLLEITLEGGALNGKPAAHVSIRDSGCGIPPEMIESVFEPFVTTKGTRGTGLGLAIAAAVIDSHEGRIDVTSEVGKGTTFDILIPA